MDNNGDLECDDTWFYSGIDCNQEGWANGANYGFYAQCSNGETVDMKVFGNSIRLHESGTQACDSLDYIPDPFPMESSIGDIFISEYPELYEHCLVEINCDEMDGKTFKDTSGNGNKGILIGDYKINKEQPGIKSRRDTIIDLPKTDTKNGAR